MFFKFDINFESESYSDSMPSLECLVVGRTMVAVAEWLLCTPTPGRQPVTVLPVDAIAGVIVALILIVLIVIVVVVVILIFIK